MERIFGAGPRRVGVSSRVVQLLLSAEVLTMQSTDTRKPCGYIFRTWITVGGQRLYAKDYGYKAWRIPIYR